MDGKKRKRHASSDRPTLDEFHTILQTLAPHQGFTKDSVELLRTAYFSYLREVGSVLVQHDKITHGDGIVETACTLNNTPMFVGWVRQAEEMLLLKGSTQTTTTTTQSKHKLSKKRIVTAEMEAAQELLLKKSKDGMAERQRDT